MIREFDRVYRPDLVAQSLQGKSCRPIADVDPDLLAELYTGFLVLFGIATPNDNVHQTRSPLYDTAVIV